MKQFKIIFTFEFIELLKTKAFKVTTAIFCIGAILLLAVGPSLIGTDSEEGNAPYEESIKFAVLDQKQVLKDDAVIETYFPKAKVQRVSTKEELEKAVKNEKVDAGFIINDTLSFEYFVLNSDMMDMTPGAFSEVLSMQYKQNKLTGLGVDAKEALTISNATASFTTTSLGNDGANNIAYTFMLIFAIYMIIIMYGNTIATSVASEKGNRTMELLVTSANPTSLIFGKVLAGCCAAFLQVGLIVTSAFVTFQLTKEAWGGMLDVFFNIPIEVMLAFFAFGALGFTFYAFIFGALGALVSKSEEVNSSSTPITLVFVAVYLVVYIGVMDPSSTVFTVASFVPFSSPMAMFSRMAMVEVPMIEVLISLAILIVSTIIVGYAASKIYRRATLMYGNQIKLKDAIRWINKKEQ